MKTPTNKDILKTFGYYLAMFITAFAILLVLLSLCKGAECIAGWFK